MLFQFEEMNLFYRSILVAIFLSAVGVQMYAQGCVAIRHFSTCSGNSLESNLLAPGSCQVGMNYRYFKSFRHFRGMEEEPDRVANNSEVINHSHGWDFTFTYGISNRVFASATLPFVLNSRSSLYEHGRTERHSSYSRGLADVRIGLGAWLLSPEKHMNGNLALGLGIKLPTGNFNASDIFYNVGPDGEPQVRPVDQSIQPGDGGFGATVDIQFYQRLAGHLYVFGSGFYLCNPKETNGTRTFRETLSPILENESIMSVTDQYSVRGGFNYSLLHQTAGISLGARYEGVPVEDLIGGSQGFRRPGSVFSVEPGINFMANNWSLSLNVPVALIRNRPQSVTDRETEELTGQPRNGDAAFADYLINLGVTYRMQ